MMIRCDICPAEFEPRAPVGGGRTSRFCSTKCREENHRRRARNNAAARRDTIRAAAAAPCVEPGSAAPIETISLPARYSAREAAVRQASQLAALLADAPADGDDPLAPPAFIADPRLAPALQVWRDRAPDVARLGCLNRTDRLLFAALCTAVAEYVGAHEATLNEGYSIPTATLHGGVMMRINPQVRRRDLALATILDLSQRFGLSPLDRYRLFALKARAPDLDEASLLDRPAPSAPTGDAAAAPQSRWDELLGPRVKPN